jgi:hypothetical protein
MMDQLPVEANRTATDGGLFQARKKSIDREGGNAH